MKRSLLIIPILAFTLAACAPETAPAPTATATATATKAPTSTPTEVVITPSMENLPAEWQGKIDHIETMTNMDGKTQRVVAVEALTDEDKAAGKTEAKLRVLQWDGKEWVDYVPQVGWAGWGGISDVPSFWEDELKPPDRSFLESPLTFKDGTKVPWGYLGPIYFDTIDPSSGSFSFYQAYIMEVKQAVFPDGEGMELVGAVPLESGDWQVIITIAYNQKDTQLPNIFSLDTLSLSDFGKNIMGAAVFNQRRSTTYEHVYEYIKAHPEDFLYRPMILGVTIDPRDKGTDYDTLNSYDQKVALFNTLQISDNPGKYPTIQFTFQPVIISDELWNRIVSSQ